MIIARIRPRRVLAVAALAGGLAVAASPAAFAHDVVIGGNPADGEVVEKFPRSIELEFSGLPQGSFTTVAVSNQDSGEILFSGEPTIDDRVVTLDLPADVTGGPGDYTVGFQITSSDGHATRNTTTFTVAGDTQPSAAAASGTDAELSGDPTVSEGAEETTDVEAADETETSSWFRGMVPLFLGALGIFAVLAVIIMLVNRGR